MLKLSTRQTAKRLGIGNSTLAHYIETGKVPAPETITIGNRTVQIWTEEDIRRIRRLLPKIANGRKTRYQKKEVAISSPRHAGTGQQSTKAKKRKPARKK